MAVRRTASCTALARRPFAFPYVHAQSIVKWRISHSWSDVTPASLAYYENKCWFLQHLQPEHTNSPDGPWTHPCAAGEEYLEWSKKRCWYGEDQPRMVRKPGAFPPHWTPQTSIYFSSVPASPLLALAWETMTGQSPCTPEAVLNIWGSNSPYSMQPSTVQESQWYMLQVWGKPFE